LFSLIFFFFQAEDGIRDFHVTGVQTCALPILDEGLAAPRDERWIDGMQDLADILLGDDPEASVNAVRDAIAAGAPLTDLTLTLKIGRASCRETVWMSVVAGGVEDACEASARES